MERAILGAMMALAAGIIERRMRKALLRLRQEDGGHSAMFGPDDR